MSGATMSQIKHRAANPSMSVRDLVRPMAGLLGILLAAIMAGLNNRVSALATADIRGALGYGFDDASWLTTIYNAGELIAMPFAAWFAITISVRRFELCMLSVSVAIAVALPFVQGLGFQLVLRFIQGLACGTMVPLLMMAALKFLPPPIKLYGLALYAMTATFAPNLAIWLAGYWVDGLFDWRWLYWQVAPWSILAAALIAWGLPNEPIKYDRFAQANWLGLLVGALALGQITIVLDQGARLDWFNSPLIVLLSVTGIGLLIVYLLTEWYHVSPFIKLQLLRRRNLGLGFSVFVFLLLALMSCLLLPASYLAAIEGYKPLQMAPIGLIVALPQLILGLAVAWLLYQRWVDARIVFAIGLLLISLACVLGSQLTVAWNRDQFITQQVLQAFGQPMAIISLLFLATSVVQPHEGPYVSGTINTLRAFGSLAGTAVVGQIVTVRSRFHAEMLLDRSALVTNSLPFSQDYASLFGVISQQALVLSISDAYRILGAIAFLLIPFVLRLKHIPPPQPTTVPVVGPHSSYSKG